MDRFDRFIESRRAEATRRTYRQGIIQLVGDPEAFIELAERDRRKAEDSLIDAVMKKRERVKGSTLVSCLARTKSMLDFYELQVNWRKVKQVSPKGSFVALDRAPLKEEVRKLLDKSPLRERVAVLCMAAGGLRVGAFDSLRVGHFRVLESGIGALRVYAGEVEEYHALLTPEAVRTVRQYLDERERIAHEVLTPDSPFLRNIWDMRDANGVKRERTAVNRQSSASVQKEVSRMWMRCGVRTNGHKPGARKDFKANHGFRKFAKSQMSVAGVSWEDSEVLLGHKLNYYKPTLEHLVEVYQKAVPFLTISEAEEVKQQRAKDNEDHQRGIGRVELELLKERDERRTAMERLQRMEESQKETTAIIEELKRRGVL